MTQLQRQEQVLIAAMDRAEVRMGELRALREKMLHERDLLHKTAKELRQECHDAAEAATTEINNLRRVLGESKTVLNSIQKHYAWKTAVHAIWGDDGLQKCFDYMQEQQELAALAVELSKTEEIPA